MATARIVPEAVVGASTNGSEQSFKKKAEEEEAVVFSADVVEQLGEKVLSIGRESVFGLTPRMFEFVKTQGQFQSHYMAYQAQLKYGYPLSVTRDQIIHLRHRVEEAKAVARRHVVIVAQILGKLLACEEAGGLGANKEDARQLRLLIWRVQDSLKAAADALEADDEAYASLDL